MIPAPGYAAQRLAQVRSRRVAPVREANPLPLTTAALLSLAAALRASTTSLRELTETLRHGGRLLAGHQMLIDAERRRKEAS